MYRLMVFYASFHMFPPNATLYTCLKDRFNCRNNASKKPTTRKSPRAPKLQEPEAGEGSSPAVARQLEFTPKPVPIIKTTTKKAFVQPPAFGDTEANIGPKQHSLAGKNCLRKSRRKNPSSIPRTTILIQEDSMMMSSQISVGHICTWWQAGLRCFLALSS
jgi:hypothetical protein